MKERTTQHLTEIERILSAVVSIKSHIPEDAMSASLLGTERSGHGVVIRDDGLIVTIGYLITEAETVWIGTADDTVVQGYIIAYDYESGLGLVKPAVPLQCPTITMGNIDDLEIDDKVFIAGSGGILETIEAHIVAKQEFAGRWEYLLDEAIYTAPAHPNWAGAALLDDHGRLCGIGSLLIQDHKTEMVTGAANMFVPINLIRSIIDDLCQYGRRQTPPRPWLGLLVHDDGDQLLISGVYRGCPGDKAGLLPGDIIIKVDNKSVDSLPDFFRRIWAQGTAGVDIPLTILRDGRLNDMLVHTADRTTFIKKETIN